MFRTVLSLPVLAMVLAGCAHTNSFGPEEQSRLILARGEADYRIGEGGDLDVSGWREAFCHSEDAAERSLRESVQDEVISAWAVAGLQSGNELPVLTDTERERMVEEVMGKARLVSSGEPRPGRAESFMGVRLSGDLSRCLSLERAGQPCASVPEHESPVDCRARAESPERLYYLESFGRK